MNDRKPSFLEVAIGFSGFVALTLCFMALLNGAGWLALIVLAGATLVLAVLLFVFLLVEFVIRAVARGVKWIWRSLTTLFQ